MKLLAAFKEAIAQMDGIKRAWFTSFNLNLSFVERYLLPALVKWEQVPRTARDFEMIMQVIHDSDMDVRFFCDGRMLEMDEGKRTTVVVHPLDIGRFAGRFQQGVFHPKVILLQDWQDNGWIFCGSANLTIGGWAHNREGVVSQKIQSRANAEMVRRFFAAIFEAVYGEDFPEDFALAAEADQEDWQFSSTLTEERPFLRQLLTDDIRELVVWSPFFTMDLPKFLKNHCPEQTVHIIPDVQSQKVRIRNDSINKAAFDAPDLSLKQYPYGEHDQDERMTHAKIWLTERHLAIGSWNMTESGIGGSVGANNNIEAGMILNVGPEYMTKVLKNCKSLKCRFMEESELDKERPDLAGDDLSYHLKVTLDWDRRKYFIKMKERADKAALMIKLPDQEIPFQAGEYHLNEEKLDNILQNHMYAVEKDGTTVHRGFIREINCAGRPAWKYDNLAELLFDYIGSAKSQTGTGHQRIAYQVASREMEDPADRLLQAEALPGGISYFGMFQAFARMREKIETAWAGYDQDPAELFRLVRGYPGSVYELAEKIAAACAVEGDESAFSPVFQWYLQQEFNLVIAMVENFASQRLDDAELAGLAGELQNKYLNPKLDLKKSEKDYLAAVERRCGYVGS